MITDTLKLIHHIGGMLELSLIPLIEDGDPSCMGIPIPD
jgi:hypothetical protein